MATIEKHKPVTDELKIPGAKFYILTAIVESNDLGGELGSLNAKYIDELITLMEKFAADAVACAVNNLNNGKEFQIGCYTISPVKKKKTNHKKINMANSVFPKGVRLFNKHEKAPDFILGSLVITPNELVKFCKENPDYLTEYQGEKQLKLVIQKTKAGGLTAVVDTYKKDSEPLPF